ncbi:c-type heme family protein [Lyngbya confervoides]|uniref:DUF3365 domain-containing protein n=1 Tax=Lyngbya confervoides BDU141951 TaxID=1574623 RepID=A0ABD4T2I4_9CYAN|nr:DUF3365 domain-containing protein [Lyngbya confervoides]MCM1982703.1 DUF3365 domain-containing protein [Lyngbya confervoides BDU141951]
MLNNLKLGAKLNVILLTVFLIIIAISGLFLSQLLQRNAEQEITSEAQLLMETMQSVRTYTSQEVNPELAARLETETDFIEETVPGYSARQVFEYLRKRESADNGEKPYEYFYYKEATLNPTNVRDQANPFEARIVEKFRKNEATGQVTGFRDDLGVRLFYVANPIKIEKESCLRCHSTPEAAPKSQLISYGDQNGFGWKLNEIVGAQMVSVPASQVFNQARQLQLSVLGILLVGFLVALGILNLFLNRSIISPLQKMSTWAQRVSTGEAASEYKHQSKDEIGILASSLNRLKVSLDMAMNMLNSPQNPPNPPQ